MVKRILMLVGDFVEDYEAMVPYQILTLVGHQVDVVCPGKKSGDTVKTAVHDFEGDQTYTEKLGHNFEITADFDQVEPQNYAGLVIPGGRAPEYLRLNPKVLELVRSFAQDKKPIAAICHGAQVLSAARVIEGVEISCYPAVAPEIELAGAKYIPNNPSYSNAHVDRNFITAPAWPAHPQWMRFFLQALGSTIIP
ncbi:DJ-1/PfpI family protein [Methylothermus subterraneus]